MKCPICKTEVQFGAPDMPFCSPRCKLLDLGKWASEEYVISTPIPPGSAVPSQSQEEES